MQTLSQLLRHAATTDGRAEAVVEDGQRTSYGTLDALADRIADRLTAQAIGAGDRVALLMQNGTLWIAVACAVSRLGAVLVPLNTRQKAGELLAVLSLSRAAALVSADGFEAIGLDFLAELPSEVLDPVCRARSLPDLRCLFVAGARCPRTAVPLLGCPEEATRPFVEGKDARPEAVSHILFTSGTTGLPKGCVFTNAAIWTKTLARGALHPWSPDDRVLTAGPFFTIGGLIGGIAANLWHRSTQIIVPHPRPEAVAAAIRAEGATILAGVPSIWAGLARLDPAVIRGCRSLRHGMTGSARVEEALLRFATDPKAGLGLALVVTYGQTEAGGVTHATGLLSLKNRLEGRVGLPLPGLVQEVRDAVTGLPLPEGAEGEVWLRGDGMMAGYLDDAAATAERLPGGWLRTGDLGRIEADGSLVLVGRAGDMIVSGGFNLHPAEVERALLSHPLVAEAAVAGVADARLGEVPAAWIVLRPGVPGDLADLRAHVEERLAGYKLPRHWTLVPALPLTAVGKVDRRALQAEWVGQGANAAPP